MSSELRQAVLKAARTLFMKNGYDAVGMRDIAQAVGKQPTQVYRLQLSKSDILAEIILELNQEQIKALPLLLSDVKGRDAFELTCSYLLGLYRSDITFMPIRSIGAAYGWMWSKTYEAAVVAQVWKLLAPIVGWMQQEDYDEVPARCYGIWSLYYVGYRRAVMHGGNADECLDEILPSLKLLFQRSRPHRSPHPVS